MCQNDLITAPITDNMNEIDEASGTPTFNDDDWKAIFGSEDDEADDVNEASQNTEPDARKRKQNDEVNGSAKLECSVSSSEVSTIVSMRAAPSWPNSIASSIGGNSETPSSAVPIVLDEVHLEKRALGSPSTMMADLCMRWEQKLRADGNIIEANAFRVVRFSVMKLIEKALESLQSNDLIHVGSLLLEAVRESMDKGSSEWESLIVCTASIYALIDEVVMKGGDLNFTKQLEMINETEKPLDKEKHIIKLAKERKKRKLEAAYAKKQERANEKRKRLMADRRESHSIFNTAKSNKTKHYMDGGNAILLMTANKFRIRKEEKRRQVRKKSQADEERRCLPQSSVSDRSLQVVNSFDGNSFAGPINADALMEECEEPDPINAVALPSFPVRKGVNYRCFQRQHSHFSALPSEGAPTDLHSSHRVRNDFSAVRGTDCSRITIYNPNQSAAFLHPSRSLKVSNLSEKSEANVSSASSANPVEERFIAQPAQKYRNLNFVKIRKVGEKPDNSTKKTALLTEKNVLFAAEDQYSVVELPSSPIATTDLVDIIGFHDYRRKYPRESAINTELGPTVSRPIGSINAGSFCESCEFTRGDIRNWFIIGSRFDRLNENIFSVKKSGCPKTHLTRVKYPPIHFRVVCDALTNISMKIAGLKIFMAIGEDWIVKRSITPQDFTSFITKFAGVLYKLYAEQYNVEHRKKVELTEDLERMKNGYAYVEMPTIILFTIPAAKTKCKYYNNAVQKLAQNWDATWRSPLYHDATKQFIQLKLIDWRQMCIDKDANNNMDMIVILMKHLMEEWGVCIAPTNRP
ncbi:unnamed protein product [Litomosoides sigmodontis]|uniref:Uncharacterized protein n=1 Tax=Litomosoides sigmodontis TaxID=42156 RepID=A0A3P6TEV6_LITSI|nr:unnamed protein product [Litomosoides sigmodontis]